MPKKAMEARPSIFRKTNKAIPELDDQTAEQLDARKGKPPRVKATFYLEPADIVAIDKMQTAEFERTGRKPERSQLVSRAIQELFGQQNI
jgi:hypothetical protein